MWPFATELLPFKPDCMVPTSWAYTRKGNQKTFEPCHVILALRTYATSVASDHPVRLSSLFRIYTVCWIEENGNYANKHIV